MDKKENGGDGRDNCLLLPKANGERTQTMWFEVGGRTDSETLN